MLSCADATRWIARRADGQALDEETGAALDAHLSECGTCREALADQRAVAALLRSRPAERVSPAFAARLAGRLDEEHDWLGLLDWRAWTVRLTPAAAALAIAAFLTGGGQPSARVNLEEWTVSAAGASSAASLLWDADISSDAVLQQMLEIDATATEGSSDGR